MNAAAGQVQPDPRAELLARFCAVSDPRDYLCHPLRVGDYLYATDGQIAIRVQNDANIVAPECDKLPQMPGLFQTVVEEFIDIPAFPPCTPCKVCAGTGREHTEACDDCDGEGEFEHGNHTYSCKNCDGDGRVRMLLPEGPGVPCTTCKGTGHDRNEHVALGSSYFLRINLDKVAALPGVKIQRHAHGNAPSRFVFDGGEGVIMPFWP